MPRRSRIRRPKLPSIPGVKAPPLWGLREGVARAYPIRELRRRENRSEIPDPPPDWPGSRPEWAVFFVLVVLGYRPGLDFLYRERIPALFGRRFGEVDFLLPALWLAFEVQGRYIHFERGIEQEIADELKRILAESEGIRLIWLLEEDLETRPFWIVQEALAGRDHSQFR